MNTHLQNTIRQAFPNTISSASSNATNTELRRELTNMTDEVIYSHQFSTQKQTTHYYNQDDTISSSAFGSTLPVNIIIPEK